MSRWISRAAPAVLLLLGACGGGYSDERTPTQQVTVSASSDGGLPFAEHRFLTLSFSRSVAEVTNLGDIRFIGPLGEVGGTMGLSSDGRQLHLNSWWQPIYPNAPYHFTIPRLKLKDGSTLVVATPVSMRAPIREMVTAGNLHACALRGNGRVYCWGTGQLGNGRTDTIGDDPAEMGTSLVPVALGTTATGQPLQAVQIASGQNHSCALLETGFVKCWGANGAGQLGRGDAVNPVGTHPSQMGNALPAVKLGSGRTAIFVAAGADRTCALLDNGELKCWGDNAFGALGIGSARPFMGHSPQEMGDALPAINLGTNLRAVHISVGAFHTCATVNVSGGLPRVKCWGSNLAGQLGLGDLRARGSAPEDMGDALPTVDLGEAAHVQRVAAGAYSTCALLDGMPRVKCWGYNANGQLGLGDTLSRGGSPGQMGDALPAVSLRPLNTVAALAAGSETACAIEYDAPRDLLCWGANGSGQLGIDSTQQRGTSADHMGQQATRVKLPVGVPVADVTLSMFSDIACARLVDGRLYCWGSNDGFIARPFDFTAVGDAPGEMQSLRPVDLGPL